VGIGMTKEKLFEFWDWLDYMFDSVFTTRRHLTIFPEGRRTCQPFTRKLKRGMIGYAWSRQLQVQVMAVFGIEHAMNEFTFKKDFEKEVWVDYRFGEIIDAKDFKTEEEFFKKIEYKFEKIFDTTYKILPERNNRDYRLEKKGEEEKNLFKERQGRKYSNL
jgi:1-acyl-sn-glycerol-3-phosphate acyltransferase